MDQPELFYEDIHDALRAVVQALGGAKQVGADLWPDKPIEQSTRLLLDCLNTQRPEKLEISQVLWLLKEARKISCHVAMHFLCRESGYLEPTPHDPEDEKEALQREFIQYAKRMEQITKQLHKEQLRAIG